MTILGTRFLIAGVSAQQTVCGISIEMLPLRHAGHLENIADSVGSGWFDPNGGRLYLQFHAIVLFSNAEVGGLWLSASNLTENIALSATPITSPVLGQRHPELPWSGKSRFVIDEAVDLAALANCDHCEVLAEVEGSLEHIGRIYVQKQEIGDVGDRTLGPPAIPTSAYARLGAGVKQKAWRLALPVIDRIKAIDRIFFFAVILPTVVSAVYFGVFASDIYISESSFIIRGPERQPSSPLGMIFKDAAFSRSQDDTYTVQEFIRSRDALHMLDERMSIGKAFSSDKVDVFSRFAGLSWDDSFEALYRYYQRRIDVHLDSSSSIVTLTTRAFSADSCARMNQMLLEMSEALVNQLNERGRVDMIEFANREVAEAQKKDREATLALARSQTESAKIGNRGRSLATKFTAYQSLTLEKEFADKMLATAMTSLEDARSQAVRKQLYLERITQPSIPDAATEPRRLRIVAAVFVLGLVAWGVLTMLIAGIREHQD